MRLSLRTLARPWLTALVVTTLATTTYGGAWLVAGEPPFVGPRCVPLEATDDRDDPTRDGSSSDRSQRPGRRTRDLRLEVSVSPARPVRGEAVTWDVRATNIGKEPVTVTFPTSQQADVAIFDDDDEIYRWSDGRAFTTATRTVEIAPGDHHTARLHEEALDVEPGEHEMIVSLPSRPAPRPLDGALTVIGAPSPAATVPPSESPGPGPEPEPPAASTPPPTSPPPASSPSPSSTASAAAVPVAIVTRLRRRIVAALLGLTLALPGSLITATPAEADKTGGRQVVVVVNTVDGATKGRARSDFTRTKGETAAPQNAAVARSTCSDCRTVAVALQSAVVIGDPATFAPQNLALALNVECTRCETLAYAYQYVVQRAGPVTFTRAGRQELRDIEAEAKRLARSALPLTQIWSELDALAARMRVAIDSEVVSKIDADADREVDLERRC